MTEFNDIPAFHLFINKMVETYNQHRTEKGDSWQDMPRHSLYGGLIDEFDELKAFVKVGQMRSGRGFRKIIDIIGDSELRQAELIDIALYAFMCWANDEDS